MYLPFVATSEFLNFLWMEKPLSLFTYKIRTSESTEKHQRKINLERERDIYIYISCFSAFVLRISRQTTNIDLDLVEFSKKRGCDYPSHRT